MVGEDYLAWLHHRYGGKESPDLFRVLSERDYIWQMALDENRAKAGLSLREQFAYETGVYLSDVADGPCSVLEMLCALADQMAMSVDVEHEPPYFLHELLWNLGITNSHKFVNDEDINYILDLWLDRRYNADGNGSIFYIPNCSNDLRNMDTWSQMNLYLNTVYPFDENYLTN